LEHRDLISSLSHAAGEDCSTEANWGIDARFMGLLVQKVPAETTKD
jgi:hypothetical protein